MNVRFFSLLMSLRIKKTVIYRRPCPVFYFCEQQCVSPAKAQPRKGPKAEECPVSLQLRNRVPGRLPPAVTKLPPGAEGLRRVGALRPRYMPGCVLGAAVAFRRLFLLFGAGPGVSSETGASACETELEEK